jgi:hypothetical protein
MTRHPHTNHRPAQNLGSKGDHDKDGKVGGAAPAVNTDEPSQLKNNIDQVLQPTGDGGIAGGELPPVGAAGNEPAEQAPTQAAKEYNAGIEEGRQANARVDMRPDPAKKLVTMKLEKNYRPEGEYVVVGTPPAAVLAGTGTEGKLWAGTTVKLTEEEAKKVHAAKIASRDFD